MWIQNKTSGAVVELSEDKWEDLKRLGWNAHWSPVKYSDEINIPKSNEVVEIRKSVSKKSVSRKANLKRKKKSWLYQR
jgi:hypothetical protein